ncbi:iron ABC transporter ATP-binding protein [Gordonibacter sp. 28C]|uniref:ABC transporter ATP-binding protein n=1 Tax=Gordonibacter sp. 28C TaxID=2078569 RepID=UPI000DF7F601|nr:ABC transporter ATP-binding protein [Gordonibacter sp. 28C]RDB60910.1 iron ABC transporter ATP-binding protein [Gordonibacter sp. 28C]
MSESASASASPTADRAGRAGGGHPGSLPMLRARDVRFSWGDHRVLQDFSLEVKRGSVVCLMGVNGCGKSTFLDCVLGENRPASGVIEVDGGDTAGMRAWERARLLAYVPQIHERTFPYTVEHLVLMGRTAYQAGFGSTDADDRRRALEALRTCGIDRLRERVCTALSGGEMQMVLLARALVQDTPLIVLDEPTAHLDFKNELVFLETVERLVGERGATVLMATHAPNQAFHLAAAGLDVKVALMSHGRVAREGTPDEVLTPDALRRYFGVTAAVAEVRFRQGEDIEGFGDGRAAVVRQIVPLSTTGSETGEDVR